MRGRVRERIARLDRIGWVHGIVLRVAAGDRRPLRGPEDPLSAVLELVIAIRAAGRFELSGDPFLALRFARCSGCRSSSIR